MKYISYIISPIFAFVFFTMLLVFHPLQWLGLKLFGYSGHKFVVDVMNWVATKFLLILGISVQINNKYNISKNTSIIFVLNHQSMFDIPIVGWVFKKYHPKFISKIELGKGIPSVSFNLRHGGSVLIDRKNGKQAIGTLGKFAKKINTKKWSVIIFPEGTRSKNGKPRPFYSNGLKTLVKYIPEAIIVPVTINNSWKVFKYGKFPLGLGNPIKIQVHKPIKVSSVPFDELMESVEKTIINNIIVS